MATDSDRARARRAALRAAAVVTLGLAAAGAAGCAQTADLFCDTFENNRYCCDRRGGVWDSTSRHCQPLVVPGPFVPPDLPA